ncbi:MAG: spore coat U domain-containing protein [Stenotrophomonas sp.]
MSWVSRVILLSVLSFAGREVSASCEVVNARPADFGSVGSITLRDAVQSTSTSDAGMHCSGDVSQPWEPGTTYFRVIFSSVDNGMVGPAGDRVSYQVHASPDRNNASALAPGVMVDLAALGVVDELGVLQGSFPRSIPLFLTLAAGANVAAGTYIDSATLSWDWKYCVQQSSPGVCSSYESGSGASPMAIKLVVQNDCAIAADDLDFGAAALPSMFAEVNGSISVICTKGSVYTVGLSGGRNPSQGQRNMLSAEGTLLAYDLFQGVGSARWGDAGAERRGSYAADLNAGSGLGTSAQKFNYRAAVYPDQAPVPAGSYVDTVLIDVAF